MGVELPAVDIGFGSGVETRKCDTAGIVAMVIPSPERDVEIPEAGVKGPVEGCITLVDVCFANAFFFVKMGVGITEAAADDISIDAIVIEGGNRAAEACVEGWRLTLSFLVSVCAESSEPGSEGMIGACFLLGGSDFLRRSVIVFLFSYKSISEAIVGNIRYKGIDVAKIGRARGHCGF